MKAKTLGRHAAAIGAMTAGTVAMLFVVVWMNDFATTPDRKPGETVASFAIEKLEPPPPEQTIKQPKPPPRPDNLPPPPNPLRGLDAELGGIDVGIPSVELTALADASDALLGATRDVVMTGDTVDFPPQAVQQGGMTYPPQARAEGVEGYVLLSVLVDKTGTVERVKVLQSEPGGVFEHIAAQGVQSWRFTPARYKGQPVKTWVRQRVSFNLS